MSTKAVASIESLCRLLSTAPLSARDVARGLGEVVEDQGPGSALVVRPASPLWREVRVVRGTGSDDPSFVELVPNDSSEIHLSELREAFGDSRELARARWNSPHRVIFATKQSGPPYTCSIIAQVETSEGEAEDAAVAEVTIRRDQQLNAS